MTKLRTSVSSKVTVHSLPFFCQATDFFIESSIKMSTMETVDIYNFGVLNLRLLKATSDCAQHPTATIIAPKGTVILGGGAYVDWDGPCSPPSPPGNMLTAMYPNHNGTTWTVASKDHFTESKARIIAYCVVAKMKDGSPISADNYKVVNATSAVAGQPTMRVDLPVGYTVVGGGARTNYSGDGSILFASYPTAQLRGWVGSAKDHGQSDPATITVWAIGLNESFLKRAGMIVRLFNTTSPHPANHPRHTFVFPDFYLTGAGARVNWNGSGNLLTASFPQDRQTVVAEGKDHDEVDRSTITAYAIGFME